MSAGGDCKSEGEATPGSDRAVQCWVGTPLLRMIRPEYRGADLVFEYPDMVPAPPSFD
jgi:hypothetical protein